MNDTFCMAWDSLAFSRKRDLGIHIYDTLASCYRVFTNDTNQLERILSDLIKQFVLP